MIIDKKLAQVCGLYCGACDCFKNNCQGCREENGMPFWTRSKPCPIFNCCINIRKLEHCGLCDDLPCRIFNDLRDPSLSDEVFNQSLKKRQNDLTKRREIGTENWLKEMKNMTPRRSR